MIAEMMATDDVSNANGFSTPRIGDRVVKRKESFFFSSRRRHTSWTGDWSSDVCSSDLQARRVWHAGASSWEGDEDINSRSIGIEIANPGHDFGYPDFRSEEHTSDLQ